MGKSHDLDDATSPGSDDYEPRLYTKLSEGAE